MKNYRPHKIEPKWQEKWEGAKIHRAVDFDKKPKSYILVEFPYPSGERLHVGHGRTYCALDTVARKYRMEGFNVLFPFGWDAFGLPAENYAIKMGANPRETTAQNIANAKEQAKSWGLSIDWEREITTTAPSYYRWTQWIFLKLFKKGLAYQAEVPVNWCPKCKTNLANEEVLVDGTHERCGSPVERRMQKQWILKITAYAERLLADLDLVEYLPKIKAQQENWIGHKEWIDIIYPVAGTEETIAVSTTRPDTNFGATFVVVAPEHPFVDSLLKGSFKIENSRRSEIEEYVEKAKNKSELERISEGRKKTGVFTGFYAVNQLNSREMPIWVTDFVLMTVGTGAVVGVPGHDVRDFDFAKQFGLPIVRVVVGSDGDASEITKRKQVQEEEGTMTNSEFLDGVNVHKATEVVMNYLEERGWGKRTVRYHLRDWVFSRQHYWGEPIPIIHCEKCGVVPVPEKDLPVELPYVESYQPSGTGESPLAAIRDWVNVKCPRCGGLARRETDTMPNWAGSNWYFIRYCDPQNGEEFANFEKLEYWMPVDLYNGGMEHTTLHLLYSRFIYKFLYDCGYVPTPEPYARRTSHGVVLGPDGRKMSKSCGNVINPDDVVAASGADTFRVYECFMGPFEQMITWDSKGVEGCSRFLNRVWRLVSNQQSAISETSKFRHSELGSESDKILNQVQDDNRSYFASGPKLKRELHRLIKKVGEDIEAMKFNTAIAAFMGFVNSWAASQLDSLSAEDVEVFLKLLAPFAPHIAEELWCEVLGNEFSIHQQKWPEYDPQVIEEGKITVAAQIDGKVRGSFEAVRGLDKEKAKELAFAVDKVKKHLASKEIVKVIWVQDRLVNLVTRE